MRDRIAILDSLRADLDDVHRAAPRPGAERLAGTLAFCAAIDRRERCVRDAAVGATVFRGYETVLRGRSLLDAGRVGAAASGICGGVHAIASAMCLEMALGVVPPPLGVVVRNLLTSCQLLSDHPMHLFVLGGPDYGASTVQRTRPGLWRYAAQTSVRHAEVHGFATLGEVMTALDRPRGALYREAMATVQRARAMQAMLGGASACVPGGIARALEAGQLEAFASALRPFVDDAKRAIAVWDDLVDGMRAFDPRYDAVGESPATLIDFGLWDNDEHYDASDCDAWQRWSTPGAIVDGQLATTRLGALHAGLAEDLACSFWEPRAASSENDLPAAHPWNRAVDVRAVASDAYSWANALTWRERVFEVGAYARLYISARARALPPSRWIASTGDRLDFDLPAGALPAMRATWRVPPRWNALERVRARAYAVAFTALTSLELVERARALWQRGERHLATEFEIPRTGEHRGIGFGGAGRGLLAHWAVIRDGAIDRYQLAIPSRINAAPRTARGEPGPCEQALLRTPILEDGADFEGIDLLRAVQSFDPCTPSTLRMQVDGALRTCVVTTDGT